LAASIWISRPPSRGLQICTETKQFLAFNDFLSKYTEISLGSEIDVTHFGVLAWAATTEGAQLDARHEDVERGICPKQLATGGLIYTEWNLDFV
jgi:hypothetical protein